MHLYTIRGLGRRVFKTLRRYANLLSVAKLLNKNSAFVIKRKITPFMKDNEHKNFNELHQSILVSMLIPFSAELT
jgi:hypothetical protein